MNTLIVCQSYHYKNTKKIANAMVAVLHAEVVSPSDVNAEMLDGYDLVCLAQVLPSESIARRYSSWSTGFQSFTKTRLQLRGGRHLTVYHRALRRQLKEKGWTVVGEFSCRGYDMYRITKLIGGIAKGRPNEQDERDAEEFAECLASVLSPFCSPSSSA